MPYHSATVAGDRHAYVAGLHADHHQMVRFSHKGQDDYKTVLCCLKDRIEEAAAAVEEKWKEEDGHRGMLLVVFALSGSHDPRRRKRRESGITGSCAISAEQW